MRWVSLSFCVFALALYAGSDPAHAGGGASGVSEKSTKRGPESTQRYQEFPKFRVDVEALQVNQDGSVVLILGYTNKTTSPLKLSLRGKVTGPLFDSYRPWEFTHLFDDAGNKYKLQSATMWQDRLTIDAGDRGMATFIFSLEGGKKKASRFIFSSSHVLILQTEEGKELDETHSISILGIEPR